MVLCWELKRKEQTLFISPQVKEFQQHPWFMNTFSKSDLVLDMVGPSSWTGCLNDGVWKLLVWLSTRPDSQFIFRKGKHKITTEITVENSNISFFY